MYLFSRDVLLYIFYPIKNYQKKIIKKYKRIHIMKAQKIVQVGDEKPK